MLFVWLPHDETVLLLGLVSHPVFHELGGGMSFRVLFCCCDDDPLLVLECCSLCCDGLRGEVEICRVSEGFAVDVVMFRVFCVPFCFCCVESVFVMLGSFVSKGLFVFSCLCRGCCDGLGCGLYCRFFDEWRLVGVRVWKV